MAVFETWLDQDLKKPVRIQYLSGNLFSQDNMGNLIGVNVTDDGAPATLGGSVSANVIRADGATVAVDSGVLSGNKASVTLPQAAYAVPGVITVVIKITSGTDVTTLAAVVTTVYRSSTDTIVDPGTIIPSIQALISQIETAVASIPSDYSSLWTTLAPAYSTSATYAVGQYVTYNGGLYRCTTAITSAESWTAAHWTAAKVGNDLSDLKSAFCTDIDNDLGKGRILSFEYGALDITAVGTTVDITSIQNVTTMRYAIGDCEGKSIVYTHIYGGGTDSGGARAWAFLDENYAVLSRANKSVYVQESLFVPTGAKYVILQTRSSYDYPYAIIGEKTFDKIENRYDISSAKDISSNDDLNDYVIPGTYTARTNEVAASVLHSPTRTSFYLLVIRVRGNVTPGASIRQLLVRNVSDSTDLIYTRYQATVDSGWGDWQKIIVNEDLQEVIANVNAEILTAMLSIGEQKTIQLDSFSGGKSNRFNVRSGGKWQFNTNYRSVMVRVPDGYNRKLIVTGGGSEGYISRLTSDEIGTNGQSVTTFAHGVTDRNVIAANANVEIDVPYDCHYILVLVRNNGNLVAPADIKISGCLINEEPKTDVVDYSSERAIASNANGMDIPQNRGILNAIKKSHQLQQIGWNPLPGHSVPGRGTWSDEEGTYSGYQFEHLQSGEYSGIPYSSVKEYDKYVGWNVSQRTFMTALHNPYSMMYTEMVLGTKSESAYGKVYHGTNCGTYFGIVCNAFALYATGWGIPWNTGEWEYINEIGLVVKEPDQSVYGMRVGDLIWEPGHGNIIVDIERNSRGEPITVYWAEAIWPFPEINAMTPEQVQTRLHQKGGIIYYYPEIYKNTEYAPSQFVAVEGEPIPEPYDYNDDICTFAGDYAAFNSSEDIYINYNYGNNTYPQMELYKDDTLLSTIDLDTSEHAVKITTSGYGKYKARLKNGSSYSDFTYFEIIETNVTPSYQNGLLAVSFTSANGIPLYAQLTFRTGESCGIIPFTDSNVTTGYIRFNPEEILKAQYPNKTFSETVYIKVFFKGDYGVVPNEYTDSGIVS